ncbi:MAG: hypothetical protein ABIP33_01405 [Pseudolysinimonas sp.]
MSVWTTIRDHVVSADAIYGTILFAALIAVASDEHGVGDGIPGHPTTPAPGVTIDLGSSASQTAIDYFDILLLSGITLLVFWLAHVYARSIAAHGEVRMRTAVWRALDSSAGMLYSVIPTTLVLILGMIGVLPDAADWSLVVAILVLGILGYQSFAERGSKVWARILGAVVSGLLGLILVVLDAAVH